jgi:hypothetical protein
MNAMNAWVEGDWITKLYTPLLVSVAVGVSVGLVFVLVELYRDWRDRQKNYVAMDILQDAQQHLLRYSPSKPELEAIATLRNAHTKVLRRCL